MKLQNFDFKEPGFDPPFAVHTKLVFERDLVRVMEDSPAFGMLQILEQEKV